MIMVKKKIINLLSLLFLFLIGCTEEEDLGTWSRPAEYTTITQLIEESVLLKDIQESADEYTFVFETQTLALPSSDVQSIEKDVEHWTTTLTFPDNSDFGYFHRIVYRVCDGESLRLQSPGR